MSDPKASTSRGSKTAAVVMLVVFLQVLVVAVLGLTAISRDRQDARRMAEEQAFAGAKRTLDRIVGSVVREVGSTLADVGSVETPYAAFELIRSSGRRKHAGLVQQIVHIQPSTGIVTWLDGDHRLYLPPAERVDLIRAAAEETVAIHDLEVGARARPLQREDELQRIRKTIALVRSYPFRQDVTGYPLSVGDATKLVSDAHMTAAAPADIEGGLTAYLDLENSLLAALEVAALNKDRVDDLPRQDRSLLGQLEELVISVTAALGDELPRIRQIRQYVEAYHAARRSLEEGVLVALSATLTVRGPEARVDLVGKYLLGLVPLAAREEMVPPGSILDPDDAWVGVAVLSADALRVLLEERAREAGLEKQGLVFTLLPPSDPPPPDVVATRDLAAVEGLRLPLRAELARIHPLTLPIEGPGEFFYWGIILLAGGGLGMGGYVLTRLYTREVRLARLKADFASNLSHELKTPLTSIGIFTEMLQNGQLETEEDKREGLDILAQEAQRLQGIVARMLDSAKREARGVTYDQAPGDLNAVIRRAVERFRRIVTEPGLRLEVDLVDSAIPMMLDEAAMDDVITNLLTNAWKYRRGEEARVQVRSRRRGRRWEVVVEDDGPGIPRRDRRRIFEMFYRSDAYLTKVAGTGLGLSLARTIVRAHKGRIRAESGEGGRGSLFRLTFPIGKVRLPPSMPSEAPVGSTPRKRSEAETTT